MASRSTQRANSSGRTVVLPIAFNVSQASSKAASKMTSVWGSNELLWNPRMVPPADNSGRPRINLALITFGTMLATFMQALDSTIANVALPHMQGSFAASQDQITWVLTSYIVAAMRP